MGVDRPDRTCGDGVICSSKIRVLQKNKDYMAAYILKHNVIFHMQHILKYIIPTPANIRFFS